jgi:hypothetical protein
MRRIIKSQQGQFTYIGYLMVLAIYSAMMLWIFARSNWLPYGLDNNETFSNLIAGRNLLEFSATNPFLLTDESTDESLSGHPYVYTHGQNFPRFATALLLLLGITAAQTHMFLAAAIGGLAVITLIFLAVKRIGGPFPATLSSAFAASSTLYFLQSAPNTWRIWQSIIIAVAIYLIAAILSGTGYLRLWRCAAVFTSFLAVSVELTFGLAIALMLTLASLVRQPIRCSQTWFNALAGPVGLFFGVGLFLSQLVGALGLTGTIDDIRYTFSSRNRGDNAASSNDFFLDNNIVFWRNSLEVDFSSTGNIFLGFISEFLMYGLGWLALPLLLLGTFLFFGSQKEKHQSLEKNQPHVVQAITLSVAVGSFASIVFLIAGETVRGGIAVIAAVLIGILFGTGIYLAGYLTGSSLSLSTTMFLGIFGGTTLVLWTYAITVFVPVIPLPQVERRDLLFFVVGAFAAMFLQLLKRFKVPQVGLTAFAKSSLAVALVLICLIALLPATAQVVAVSFELGLRNSPGIQVLAVLLAWIIAGIWAATRNPQKVTPDQNVETLNRLCLMFCIAIAAVAFVYLLSPGYFVTGYSSRLVPFFGLFLPVVAGATAAVMIQQFWNRENLGLSNIKRPFILQSSFTMIIFLLWLAANLTLVPKLFNDDFATAYEEIQRKRPVGIVSSSYPAAWAQAADTWAYMDAGLPSPPNLDQVLAGEQYVWIKGGLENPDFKSPTAAICWAPISPGQLLLRNPEVLGPCSLDRFFNENTQLRTESIMQADDNRFLIAFGRRLF